MGAHRLLAYLDACTVWALTPYENCEFRCVYCNVRAQGTSRPFLPPADLLVLFRRELAQVPAQYSIILGVLGDAYPPIEAEVGATRLLLRELIQAQRAFHVVTKGDTVCRDVDLLAPYARCCVHISLCTVDENALARLDPGAPSALTRLRVVEHLRKEGVPVEVKAAPWIPGVTDPDALVARVPFGVPVEFAPLNVANYSGRLKLLGRRYTQDAVDTLYSEARARFAPRPHVRWLDPSGLGHHPFAAVS